MINEDERSYNWISVSNDQLVATFDFSNAYSFKIDENSNLKIILDDDIEYCVVAIKEEVNDINECSNDILFIKCENVDDGTENIKAYHSENGNGEIQIQLSYDLLACDNTTYNYNFFHYDPNCNLSAYYFFYRPLFFLANVPHASFPEISDIFLLW